MRRDPLNTNEDDDADLICVVSIARRICGRQAARNLVRDFGGTRIQIPIAVRSDHPISKSIGHESAIALAEECGGVPSYIPMSLGGRAERRRGVVQALISEGRTVAQIARATSHSERSIGRDISILRRRGVEIDPKRRTKRKPQ